jgi:ribonuclease III
MLHRPPPPRMPHPDDVAAMEDDQLDSLEPFRENDVTPEAMEAITGFKPMQLELYVRAFTHKSADPTPAANYEMFEFLGDAVLNFTTAKFLFHTYPDEQTPGFHTVMRTKLTCTAALWEFSKRLQLERYTMMAGREMVEQTHKTKKVQEDVLEALIGAIYLDLGILKARQFVERLFRDFVDWEDIFKNRNYKDVLMRHQHAVKLPLPTYAAERDHDAGMFTVTCTVPQARVGTGQGRTKREAEQRAARCVLEHLGVAIDY